jgi:hypothetical protein
MKLEDNLVFSFKIDQLHKISSLFFSFESDKKNYSMHFLECLFVTGVIIDYLKINYELHVFWTFRLLIRF